MFLVKILRNKKDWVNGFKMKLTRTEIKKMEKFMSNMVIREIEEPSPEQLNNTEAWLEDAKNE